MKALWTSARTCQWVEPNEGATGENAKVYFYRNRNGRGLNPAKLPAPGEQAVYEKRRLNVEVEDDSD